MAYVWASNTRVLHCRVLPLGEFTVTIPEQHATFQALQGAVTWRNQCNDGVTLQGVRVPSAILKIVFCHILFFLMQFTLWRAAAFVSSPIHLLFSLAALGLNSTHIHVLSPHCKCLSTLMLKLSDKCIDDELWFWPFSRKMSKWGQIAIVSLTGHQECTFPQYCGFCLTKCSYILCDVQNLEVVVNLLYFAQSDTITSAKKYI